MVLVPLNILGQPMAPPIPPTIQPYPGQQWRKYDSQSYPEFAASQYARQQTQVYAAPPAPPMASQPNQPFAGQSAPAYGYIYYPYAYTAPPSYTGTPKQPNGMPTMPFTAPGQWNPWSISTNMPSNASNNIPANIASATASTVQNGSVGLSQITPHVTQILQGNAAGVSSSGNNIAKNINRNVPGFEEIGNLIANALQSGSANPNMNVGSNGGSSGGNHISVGFLGGNKIMVNGKVIDSNAKSANVINGKVYLGDTLAN